MPKVIIEISAHHCHLSQNDLEILFGKNYQLTPEKPLSQIGQFAAKETVTVKIPESEITNVRILGPVRKNTQVEISKTEAYQLKVEPPVVECTCLEKVGGCAICEIIGPRGKIKRCALIVAHRHLHCDPKTAQKLKLKDGQLVSVKTKGSRGLTFHNVLIRIHKDFVFRMHLDTDEGNAAGVKTGDIGEIII